nr:MAG TPA: hypothetical protein [Caudoviricetes sp.]
MHLSILGILTVEHTNSFLMGMELLEFEIRPVIQMCLG